MAKQPTAGEAPIKIIFPDKTWYISDGTLNVTKGSNAESQNGGDIVTKEEFSAFDLQFEFQLTDTANSGVKYFVTEKEKTTGRPLVWNTRYWMMINILMQNWVLSVTEHWLPCTT